MRNTRYWLLLRLAEIPKAFVYGAGILIALALMLGTICMTAWLDKQRVSQQHHEALDIFEAIVQESTAVLQHLHTHDAFECNTADLIHLNAHLLQARHVREIGLMDSENRLICTSTMGKLDTPVKGDFPVHVSRSGLTLLNNVPLQVSNKALHTMVLLDPPYNLAISPFATKDIYTSADASWLRTEEGLVLLSSAVTSASRAVMEERLARREDAYFEPHWQGYALITARPGLDIVLQSQRSMASIIKDSGVLLPNLLAGSLLIALLSVVALMPHVLRLGALRHRIAYLCDEAHLTLVYQPVFDLHTMRPIGCEVLARMKENGKSWMPDKIIPAILDAGLEYQFDCAVTRKAMRELAAHLPARDNRFCIALNYFPESVRSDDLVPMLTRALAATTRSDLEVCVEITEHSVSDEVMPAVLALKAQGFLIAVDDFGTGYSNLKSVTQFSPDLLKIDRSFVYELEDATVRSSLIPEILNIARAVHAQTIAEGIETLEQARLLAAAGVRYGQGYALARPMEMTQFIAFLARYK